MLIAVGVLGVRDDSSFQQAIETTSRPESTSPPTTTAEPASIDSFGDDAVLDALWSACADGDLESCDTLWLTAPVDSRYEAFGYSCGERGAADGRCIDTAAGASHELVWVEDGSFGMPIPAGWDTVERVFSGDDTEYEEVVTMFASPSVDSFVDDRSGSWEFTTVGVAVWLVHGAPVGFVPDLDVPADCLHVGDVASIDTPGGFIGYGDLYTCTGALTWATYILTHTERDGIGVVIEGVYGTPAEEDVLFETLTGLRLP